MRTIRIFGSIVVIVLVLFTIIVKISLQPRNDRLQYKGSVYDIGRAPVPGVIISTVFSDGTRIENKTDSKGFYQVTSPLGASATEISAKKSGWLFVYHGNLDPYIPGILEGTEGFSAYPEHSEPLYFDNVEKQFIISKEQKVILGENHLNFKPAFIDKDQWKLSVEMKNGKVTKSTEGFATIAADDQQYLKNIFYDNTQPDNPHGKDVLIYFKKENGTYGWLNFKYNPFSSNGPTIYISSWGMNLAGGKQLLHSVNGKAGGHIYYNTPNE